MKRKRKELTPRDPDRTTASHASFALDAIVGPGRRDGRKPTKLPTWAGPTIPLDAATVARLRRKARRVLTDLDDHGYALATDLLRVLDGKPRRKR